MHRCCFFQPVTQCWRVFSQSCWSSLYFSGEDRVQPTVVLYCPACLCAGCPEVVFHVPVPLKGRFLQQKMGCRTNVKPRCFNWPPWHWSVHSWWLSSGRNMPLYTLTVLHVALHTTILSAIAIWFCYMTVFLYCCPVACFTCLLPLFLLLYTVQQI